MYSYKMCKIILSIIIISDIFFQEREIMHIQYIDWPDHGIPEDPQPFISKSFTYMYIYIDNNQICAIQNSCVNN